jgi:DNA mismatch repair protein MutL
MGLQAGEFKKQETISFYHGQGADHGSYQGFGAPVRDQIASYQALHPAGGLRGNLTSDVAVLERAQPMTLPPTDDEQIPPLGYAIAQLKGIYILAENSQ